ncbi:MAG: hypothetical protein J2P37_15665, partial [Ktedonobacteraceae bacterium]|nr:hypothetical protein [Ktedonobacteraceae bacterium]
ASGPIPPPHLQASQTTVDMGDESQRKGNIHPLDLNNTGGGVITWLASSDQPWLRLTPMQGRLDKTQKVFLSVTRAHLEPGQYQGTITIASNAGNPLTIHVKMSVLQTAPTAILGVSAVALSFSATDGGPDPGEQVVMVNNPGSHQHSWSLNKNVEIDGQVLLGAANWLSVESTSGTITPGTSIPLRVLVHSQPLLEGIYTRMLSLTTDQGNQTDIVVSLNVGRHCGIAVDTADLSFNTAVGQSSQPRQGMNIATTAGCPGTFPWRTYSLANWLAAAPEKGQLAAKAHGTVSATINGRRLQAGSYSALLVFVTTLRTDMVLAQLTVQPTSQLGLGQTTASDRTPSADNISLQTIPSHLGFSATQGQTSIPGRSVSISSSEHSPFSWRASFDADWLTLTPQKGTVPTGQHGQMVVSSNAAGLAPGTYTAHISITPLDTSGKPIGKVHVLPVTFNIAPQCVFQVSPEKLSFSALLQSSPPAQSITLKGGSDCAYPVTWTASVDPDSRSWLFVSPASNAENGNGSTLTVSVSRQGMLLGSYTGHITITAFDSHNAPIEGGTQTVTVTLTVFG